MTFSSLISGTVPHHNKFSSRRGQSVDRMLQHHWAGLGGGDARLLNPYEQASCTYIIYTDGRIMGQVPEEFRPWTSGGAIDESSVTIEVQNTTGQFYGNDSHPDSWQISAAAFNSIIRLTADVARRHGWSGVNTSTYQGHRQYYATACPGGYLWSRMDLIRTAAQALLKGGLIQSGGTTTKPKPKEWDEMASKNDIKAALREVIVEPNILDQIALAVLKRDCFLVDPSGKSGKTTGTTSLAKKVNWMAHNDAQHLNVLRAIGDTLGVKLDAIIEAHDNDEKDAVPHLTSEQLIPLALVEPPEDKEPIPAPDNNG